MPRRVILELKNGRQIAGHFLREDSKRYETVHGNATRIVNVPGIVVKRFSTAEFYANGEIEKRFEANLESQM